MAAVTGREEGVWYRQDDYAGFFRRLGVDLVDILVLMAIWFVLGVVYSWISDDERGLAFFMAAALPILAFGYFVLMKRSFFRTAGYRLFGVRIVDLQGRTPGLFALTLRLGFAVFGPLNFLLDLFWIPSDSQKQALRDRFAGTMVVKARAEPAGRGLVVHESCHVMGWTFIFPEVRGKET
jgi:uncharacterized RDD family membrane protein YckC